MMNRSITCSHFQENYCNRTVGKMVEVIEYEIFGEGSHISTNQKREKGALKTGGGPKIFLIN